MINAHSTFLKPSVRPGASLYLTDTADFDILRQIDLLKGNSDGSD